MGAKAADGKSRGRGGRKAVRAIVTLVVAAGLAGGGYYVYKNYFDKPAAVADTVTQQTAVAARGDISVTISGAGPIAYSVRRDVKSEVKGTVLKANFSEGDLVNAGDVIFEVDNKETLDSIAQIENEIRQQEISNASAKPQDFGSMEIRATGDGIVSSVSVRAGDDVSKGAGVLTLSDKSRLSVTLPFAPEDAARLSVGQAITLVNLDGDLETCPATIAAIQTEGGGAAYVQITAQVSQYLKNGTNVAAVAQAAVGAANADAGAAAEREAADTGELTDSTDSTEATDAEKTVIMAPVTETSTSEVAAADVNADADTAGSATVVSAETTDASGAADTSEAAADAAATGTETSTETVGTADAATTGSAPAAAELSELAAARLAQRTAASAAPSLEIRALDHGTLAFRSDLTVKSLGTGTVANVLVKENDYVKEGQLLIELTNSDTSYAYTRELNALKMESLETQLEATRETLDYYVIYAPIDGMFVSQPVSENDYIEINQVVCTIIDPQSLEFVTDVDELDIDKVSLGQRVEVSFDALSDTALRPITGEVKKIAIEGASSGGVTTYGVTVGVEASDRIKAGMNADGLIYIQSKTDVITIPVEAVTIMGGGNRAFVYVKDEGAAGAGAADGTGAETAGAGEGGAPGTDVVGGVGGAPGAGAGDVNTGGINTADATTTADAPGVNATDETGGVPGADAATRPSGQRGMPPQGFDAADASGRPSRPSGAWAGAGRNPGDPGGIPGAAAMTTPAASSETAEASSAPSDETAEASSSSASSSETAEASSASSNAAETGSAPLDTPAPAPALAPAPSDAFPSNGTGQVFSGRRGVTIVDGASGTGYYEGAVIRVVEIGISNDSSIEIVSGLSEGEAVVLPATIGAAATSAAQGAIPAQGGGMVQFAAPAGGANMGGGNRTFLGGG